MPSRVATALVIAVIALISGCGTGKSGAGSGTVGPYDVEQLELDHGDFTIEGVAGLDGGVAVALVSSENGGADLAVVSHDAGVTWQSVETGLGSHDPPETYTDYWPTLLHAGDWLIAVKPVRADDESSDQDTMGESSAPPTAQSFSADGGLTWHPLVLDAASAVTGVLSATTTPSGELLVGGYRADSSTGQYDAAFWRGSPGEPLTPVALGTTSGLAENQMIIHLASTDDRIIATGRDGRLPGESGLTGRDRLVTTASTDDGENWIAVDGVPDIADIGELTVRGATVYLEAFYAELSLAPGESAWSEVPEIDFSGEPGSGAYREASAVVLPTGDRVATWVDDDACDCSVAYAGIMKAASASAQELKFETCADTSLRGEKSVGPPVLLGSDVLAVGTCVHHDDTVVGVAWTEDGGQSWATVRLGAVDGLQDVVVSHRPWYGTIAFSDSVAIIGTRDDKLVVTRLTA